MAFAASTCIETVSGFLDEYRFSENDISLLTESFDSVPDDLSAGHICMNRGH